MGYTKATWRVSILHIIDKIFLLGIGREYSARLANFADNIEDIEVWRKDQQDEWDRLTKSVIILPIFQYGYIFIVTECSSPYSQR
jgi:hypothetical protein